jgi:predicted aldo/keto reductase-like oxidoreductase
VKKVEELQMLIEIVEGINYFKRLRKYHEDDLNKPIYHFMSDKLRHKIDICTKCIGRLESRYNNLMK